VPKRKVPEAECALEDKIHAGQRLTAFATAWRSGSPFQRRTPRPACKSRKTLPFRFEQPMLPMPSLEVNRDRIQLHLFLEIIKVLS
jgi:hypothetical protein